MKLLIALALTLSTTIAHADLAPREGWVITPTDKSFKQLVADVKLKMTRRRWHIKLQASFLHPIWPRQTGWMPRRQSLMTFFARFPNPQSV